MGLQRVEPSEHILCTSYEQLAKEVGATFCANEGIKQLFRDIEAASNADVLADKVLVSACSDYGIHEQEKAHPNGDLVKLAQAVRWDEIAGIRDRYFAFQVGPTCDPGQCDLSHRYSIKIDRGTCATFDYVPPNIKRWFVANLNADVARAEWLPFGLSSDPPGYQLLPNYMERPKAGLLYVNFQHRTMERLALKQHYSQLPWATTQLDTNLTIEQYLESVATHKFVLCPTGNGLDCYRTYEALYLGCIPIIQRCRMAEYMQEANLPVLVVDRLHGLDDRFLGAVWEHAQQQEFDYSTLKLSYWRDRFKALV